MTGIDGEMLREWRRSRGWDVAKTARELRRVASEPIAAHDALVRMIRGWERSDHELSERYELLYRRLGLEAARDDAQPGASESAAGCAPDAAQSVVAWVAATNTSDDAIDQIDRAATYLAEVHAQIPAPKVLSEVLALNREVRLSWWVVGSDCARPVGCSRSMPGSWRTPACYSGTSAAREPRGTTELSR
jgi:hypothetical protein